MAVPTSGGLVTRLRTWALHPFSEQMDLINWIGFTVVIVTTAYLWTRVLNKIEETGDVPV